VVMTIHPMLKCQQNHPCHSELKAKNLDFACNTQVEILRYRSG